MHSLSCPHNPGPGILFSKLYISYIYTFFTGLIAASSRQLGSLLQNLNHNSIPSAKRLLGNGLTPKIYSNGHSKKLTKTLVNGNGNCYSNGNGVH